MAKRKTIGDKLREAIEAAPVSRYRIAKDTGVNAAILSKFVNRLAGLDLGTVDKLAAYLELDLVKRKGKGR